MRFTVAISTFSNHGGQTSELGPLAFETYRTILYCKHYTKETVRLPSAVPDDLNLFLRKGLRSLDCHFLNCLEKAIMILTTLCLNVPNILQPFRNIFSFVIVIIIVTSETVFVAWVVALGVTGSVCIVLVINAAPGKLSLFQFKCDTDVSEKSEHRRTELIVTSRSYEKWNYVAEVHRVAVSQLFD